MTTKYLAEALRELIALKDLKEGAMERSIKASMSKGANPSERYHEWNADYKRRKPLAWEAARAALASHDAAQSASRTVASDRAVLVCPTADRECGDRATFWCANCPKRGAAQSAGEASANDSGRCRHGMRWENRCDVCDAPQQSAGEAPVPAVKCRACGDYAAYKVQRLECKSCGSARHAEWEREPSVPIEQLLSEYAAECSDFSGQNGYEFALTLARRYAERGPNSQMRCVVHTLLANMASAPPSPAVERDERAETWKALYRKAVNCANGLTNYVEDRPELRRIERELTAIEAAARAALEVEKP